MFFQHNPNGAVWGDMHWNDAVSDDMVHLLDEASVRGMDDLIYFVIT